MFLFEKKIGVDRDISALLFEYSSTNHGDSNFLESVAIHAGIGNRVFLRCNSTKALISKKYLELLIVGGVKAAKIINSGGRTSRSSFS